MRSMMRPLATAFLTGAWLLSIAAANGQAQSPSPSLSDPASKIPDQMLDAAAAALKNVAEVKQEYQQRIEAAGPSDKERIAKEGNNALVKAVTDQGLSIEEYTTILRVAQNDPEVREKIFRRLDLSTK